MRLASSLLISFSYLITASCMNQAPKTEDHATATSCSEHAKIAGVITDFVGDHSGDKPDIGAEVFLIESNKTFLLTRKSGFVLDLGRGKIRVFKLLYSKPSAHFVYPTLASTITDSAGHYELAVTKSGSYEIIILPSHIQTYRSDQIFVAPVMAHCGQITDISTSFVKT